MREKGENGRGVRTGRGERQNSRQTRKDGGQKMGAGTTALIWLWNIMLIVFHEDRLDPPSQDGLARALHVSVKARHISIETLIIGSYFLPFVS